MRTTDTHIYFWGSFLSNWIPANCDIQYEGFRFYTSEQLFMYFKAKFFGDNETAQEIVENGKNPRDAKDLGRKVKNYDEKRWTIVREEVMYQACMFKFKSDLTLKAQLLATGDKILVEGTPFDKWWGVMIHWKDDRILDEKNWKGQNLLGKVLMRVRETLRTE